MFHNKKPPSGFTGRRLCWGIRYRSYQKQLRLVGVISFFEKQLSADSITIYSGSLCHYLLIRFGLSRKN